MTGVTLESCRDIIEQFEPCPENKSKAVLGIDGERGITVVRLSRRADGQPGGLDKWPGQRVYRSTWRGWGAVLR